MVAEKLVVIAADEAYLVAYASDPADWIARFEKRAGFPARVWAERMAQLTGKASDLQARPGAGPEHLSSALEFGGQMDTKTLFEAVVNGEEETVVSSVQAALANGASPAQILNGTLIPAMNEVGRLFEIKDYYIPEMLLAANAMQAGVAVLKPLLASAGAPPAGKAAIGTVKGDLHDIGKNLVIMMLEGAGFDVLDLGVDVPPERFVQAAQAGYQLIGLSAMLTTTMANMKAIVDALKADGTRDQVKVLVGGAPLTKDYADLIGADGFASDASAAVRTARQLLNLPMVAVD